MSRYKNSDFLIKPRWLAAHLLVVFLSILFSSLGFWQLDRLKQAKEHNMVIEKRHTQSIKTIDELDLDSQVDDFEFSRLRIFGKYDPENEILLRGRSFAGQAGYNLFTPFVLVNKKVIMVERGWVAFEYDNPPILAALPPKGFMELVGTILGGTSAPQGWNAFLAPKDPAGDLIITAYTDLKRLQKQMPYDLENFYLRLIEQKPPQNKNFPYTLRPLESKSGSHLSYALQWFSFVIIGLIGYGLILKKRYLKKVAAL